MPPQDQKFSVDSVYDYMHSDAYTKLPDDQKKKVVDFLKTRTFRELPPVPNAGKSMMRRGAAGSRMFPIPPEKSAIGGFMSRASDSVEGIGDLFKKEPQDEFEKKHPNLKGPVSRMARGFGKAEAKLGGQTKEQFKRGEYTRAGISGLSMANPFATSSVADINEMEDQGRHQEAIGAGAFEVLNLLAGKGAKNPLKPKSFAGLSDIGGISRANKLTAAAGGGRNAFREVLPELSQTVKQAGQPKSVGSLMHVVNLTGRRLESQFNVLLQPIRGQRMVPMDVANGLLREANKPNLAMTAEGRMERSALRNAAVEFQRPWSMEELNLERMRRYKSRMESKTSVGQMQAMRSSVDASIDKIVEDNLRTVVYDAVDRANPGKNVRQLKSRQSSLLELQDRLEKHIETLADEQGKLEGSSLMEKLGISLSGHTSGVTPRIHGLVRTLEGGPEKVANKRVKSAFPGPLAKGLKASKRAAILAMPLTVEEKDKSADEQ